MSKRTHQPQSRGNASRRRVIARDVPRAQVDLKKLSSALLAVARAEAEAEAEHQRRRNNREAR